MLGTWAETVVSASTAGKASLRLRTCGGAVLFVNGAEAGWMAPYGRNLEAQQEFEVALVAGVNEIRIWFDDLAERDARYFFQLDYLAGPAVEHAMPTSVAGATAAAMEEALEAMRFERPAYGGGEVALVTDAPVPVGLDVKIAVEGDFMSIEKPTSFALKLKAGATRLPIAVADDLPADFRHFKVSLSKGGFIASRVFGVEICHADRQGTAPAALADRIAEALDEISAHAESDTVRALARLATGRGGKETDAMIAGALPAIEDCHDCADFILVPLLWARHAFGEAIAPKLRKRIDAATLNYRFWMDEPGNDVQWYFSENHALLFHTAAYLAGHFLPGETFVRSGRTGAEQSEVGLGRVRAWLDHFELWEMAEFNSAPYFPIDLKGLTILFALAPHADVRRRAGKAIVRLLEIVARSAQQGTLTGAQGRSYEHTLRASRSLELSGVARMLWGKGNYGMRFHALPQLALCIRDHGLRVPAKLAGIANFSRAGAQEWTFAQGQNRIAKLYHYKMRGFSLGTAAAYRWNSGATRRPCCISGSARTPTRRYGSTILERPFIPAMAVRPIGAVPARCRACINIAGWRSRSSIAPPSSRTSRMRGSRARRSTRPCIDGKLAFARSGNAVAMLSADRPFELVTRGPTAGNELRVPGRKAVWIVRLGATGSSQSAAGFAKRFSPLSLRARKEQASCRRGPGIR